MGPEQLHDESAFSLIRWFGPSGSEPGDAVRLPSLYARCSS